MMTKTLDDVRVDFSHKPQGISSKWNSAFHIEGVIDLIVAPPFDIVSYVRLLRYLDNIQHLRILSTCGDYEQDSFASIKILAIKSFPLYELILDIPGIQDAKVLTNGEMSSFGFVDSVTFEPEESDQKCQILLSFEEPASLWN